jgi:transketolase
MGFHYTGPIDGHDINALVATLRTLKTLKGPQLLHVITTKGKGYELAEGDQIEYHAVGPFDPNVGLVKKPAAAKPTYTQSSATGCATWPPPMTSSWGSRRRCAKARAWCASARNIRNAISTWPSPNSTR